MTNKRYSMYQKIFLSLAAVALLASCSVKEDRMKCVAPVTVRLSGFSVSQEDLPDTRATVSDYNGVKVLTLAFYDGASEVYKVTQDKDDPTTFSTFGEFSTTLPLGSYTMVALAYVLYDDDALTLTSPTQAEYTGGCVRETFSVTQAVNVTSTQTLNLSATLDRTVSCLKVISTDGKTANVSNVRMTFSAGGKRFSPSTGLATVNTGSESIVRVSASEGETSTSIGYVFLTSDEQTMDVTIETLDADGNTILSQTVTDVPFKRNRRTKLTGALYSANASAGSFQLNTEWVADYNDTF